MLAADGCPAAVALLLALGLERCLSHGEQPAALLNHLPLPAMAPACRHGAMQANYRYLLRLVSRKSQRVSLACWRRYPGGLGWQRRCGPMPLERFLQRFLEPTGRRQASFSQAGASSRGASS